MRELKFEYMLLRDSKVIRKHVFVMTEPKPGYALIPGMTEIFRQYTGLMDKNGREIYEGDIVETPNNHWGVIQYSPPFFGVTVSETEVSHYRRDWMESCVVIGNIHQNPELLEATP